MLRDVPVTLIQEKVDIDEIQSSDGVRIATQKALDAYRIVQKPLFITDTFWSIPALNGFPGAYMKEVESWLTTDDFLRLLHGVSDRSIIAYDHIVYIENTATKIFTNTLYGTIAETPSPHSLSSIDSLVQFEGRYLADIKSSSDPIREEAVQWEPFRQFLQAIIAVPK